ncbi:oligosaccharide flippase family protein [Planktothricoides raciborskii]|uniref:Oligosaccharide flippase family protein n=1 Tax=Planktothricoides raciborskii FACHB-1370 TaxID=2949576 RepID=A0ABR8EC38_9CYAN|nr:oligosaccharide flippase family protein [Planktothricoides raciborskii]MBD2544191.1 oligosaccharide flippase family protein [Planktothricoides raciborskii FACHB-1370]MBD2583913.1 oligosaccharide flippase family protein [Planktothricoides raciborskii FACHB-1261]
MPETEPQNQPKQAETQQGRSLKKKAIRGAAWTLFGYGGSQSLRLVSNLILTRLLVPEVFGLMALVQTFQTGLTLFSDIGIRPSIIQNKRGDDPTFLNTAWTLQVIRGFWIWFGCTLVAWPVSRFYDDTRFLWLLPIVALTSIFQGFQSTALATLNRRMAIGKLTIFEFQNQIVSLTVMIVLAWFNRSIWAIVGGMLVSGFLKMLWSHRLVPEHSDRFAWDKKAIKDLISFGKWIFVSTAITFLASQSDKMMLGKLLPLEFLGIYTIAFTFADIPTQVMQRINGQIIFPFISKKADLPREILRAKILQKRWLIIVIGALILTFFVSFGDLIILILYNEKYKQAAWMLPILCLGIWPRVLLLTISPSLMAIGKPVYVAMANLLKFIYMLTLLPTVFYKIGVLGALIVIAFNDIPSYIVNNYGLWREGLSGLVQDIQATLLLIGLIAMVLTCRYSLGFGITLNGML